MTRFKRIVLTGRDSGGYARGREYLYSRIEYVLTAMKQDDILWF